MGENSQPTVDDVVSTEEGSEYATNSLEQNEATNSQFTITTVAFSKKAIHQRDADENLFLRFLELDPPFEAVPPPNPSATDKPNEKGDKGGVALVVPSVNRRQSSAKAAPGRTPFTITKKLVRTQNKGFGFSIVWTHPPRIEKVEPGLPADKCGICKGDYVIFVDKHNVVTMPEMDILNLIRSQGNVLLLEIFRRPANRPENDINSRLIQNSNNEIQSSNDDIVQRVIKTPTHLCQQMVKENVTSTSSVILSTVNKQIYNPSTPAMMTPKISTGCSNTSTSVETTSKKRLHLPQVTFSKESILLPSVEDQRRKILYQLINREQNLVTALNFGIDRFVTPLKDRKDVISPSDHRTLFQNIEEILTLSKDILDQLINDEHEPDLDFVSRVYLSKTTAFCAAYKKYCNGLKRADCVLVNKSRNSNSEFMTFIVEPPIPRKRPDLTTFIHRPLQHFREILKLLQITASQCRVDSDEYKSFSSVINDLQCAYREITVGGGLMEPLGEGRPLLTLQDLESRLVFTRCKPFVLASAGRQWIFGGDLSRVEGRSIKPYWTLLFSDILLFAKVSRDRVLFITEEPLQLANITDSCFNIRKKATEFRITIDPDGKYAESPTAHCAPDITRTPRRNSRRRSIILRAPSSELKAVWQNLLQRQIFLVNAVLGSTPLSSPLESPDIIHTFVPLSDIGAVTTSMASIKLSSLDSFPMRYQQQHQTLSKSENVSKNLEEFIDEKCRLLNKSGTSKGGALHLAQWMKGQLDKESERNPIIEMEHDIDEELVDWSSEKLKKRSRELELVDSNDVCQPMKFDIGKRNDNRMEELMLSEMDEGSKSPSRSTTSDSQITVRSSPNANNTDKYSVCLKCHKNCKNKSSSSHASVSSLLKVQHNQFSPNNCCSSSTSTIKSLAISNSTIIESNYQSSQLNGELHLINGNYDHEKSYHKSYQTSETSSKCQILCNCKSNSNNFNQDECIDKFIIGNTHLECDHKKYGHNDNEVDCKCRYSPSDNYEDRCENNNRIDKDEEWSKILLGLSKINPSSTLVHVDPFEAVPTISVVPPTPEGIQIRFNQLYGNSNMQSREEEEEISPEDSPIDDEPPYKVLNSSLKRYGTLSSLEKVPSGDTDDKTYDSSEEHDSDDDIKVVTKEIYDNNNSQSLRNWTARAGSYVAEKMSFFEESKAFFDKYLGRKELSLEQNEDEVLDDCTSGATSGEEVWGTPTSGGENEEMHMFNSDHAHSSPTKSTSSMTGDDDTELMMDELLMAPPMTASTVRGLLPRRRLEPLFEEDTESGEESNEDGEDFADGDNKIFDGGNSNQGKLRKDFRVLLDGRISRNSHETNETLSGSSSRMTTPVDQIEMEITKTTIMTQESKAMTQIGEIKFGSVADTSFTVGPTQNVVRDYVANTDSAAEVKSNIQTVYVGGLSPRLEMRLALNQDIMGDEDLINYDPGPDLTAVLGHDLSTYRQLTPRDILNRTMIVNRPIQAKPKSILLQQRNSKMDTPTPNRKKPNQNTWNSSASVDPVDESALSDLERLARREKMFSMSQLRSGRVAPQQDDHRTRTIGRNDSTLSLQLRNNKKNKFFNFLSRRNSDNHILKYFSKENGENDVPTFLRENDLSPRKDVDKTLDRRFWKQLSKRRRSSSASEISGNS